MTDEDASRIAQICSRVERAKSYAAVLQHDSAKMLAERYADDVPWLLAKLDAALSTPPVANPSGVGAPTQVIHGYTFPAFPPAAHPPEGGTPAAKTACVRACSGCDGAPDCACACHQPAAATPVAGGTRRRGVRPNIGQGVDVRLAHVSAPWQRRLVECVGAREFKVEGALSWYALEEEGSWWRWPEAETNGEA